jgi:hypothetical protein
MAYRVLVPWVVGAMEAIFPSLHPHRVVLIYEPLKILLMAYALWATAYSLGTKKALLLAAVLPTTFLYDYWDWALEVGALALALGSDNTPLISIAGGLAVLSRPETVILIPITYWLRTRDSKATLVIATSVFIPMAGVRLWVGHQPLWCPRLMYNVNWRDLLSVAENNPLYLGEIVMAILFTATTLWSIRNSKTWIVPVSILIAGWMFARVGETRVLLACVLWWEVQ